MQTTSPPPPRTQRDLREEVVLETAARWFTRHGFHGASLALPADAPFMPAP